MDNYPISPRLKPQSPTRLIAVSPPKRRSVGLAPASSPLRESTGARRRLAFQSSPYDNVLPSGQPSTPKSPGLNRVEVLNLERGDIGDENRRDSMDLILPPVRAPPQSPSTPMRISPVAQQFFRDSTETKEEYFGSRASTVTTDPSNRASTETLAASELENADPQSIIIDSRMASMVSSVEQVGVERCSNCHFEDCCCSFLQLIPLKVMSQYMDVNRTTWATELPLEPPVEPTTQINILSQFDKHCFDRLLNPKKSNFQLGDGYAIHPIRACYGSSMDQDTLLIYFHQKIKSPAFKIDRIVLIVDGFTQNDSLSRSQPKVPLLLNDVYDEQYTIVVNFDYIGFARLDNKRERSVKHCCESVIKVFQYLKHLFPQETEVTLVGYSIGGVLALCLAAQLVAVQRIVLIQPKNSPLNNCVKSSSFSCASSLLGCSVATLDDAFSPHISGIKCGDIIILNHRNNPYGDDLALRLRRICDKVALLSLRKKKGAHIQLQDYEQANLSQLFCKTPFDELVNAWGMNRRFTQSNIKETRFASFNVKDDNMP